MKFYKCPICGNIITVIKGNENLIKCCGVSLEELIPGTVDAAVEKHVPIYEIEGDKITVSVGEVTHPMTEEHYIEFIAQVTDKGINLVKLTPNDEPKAIFPYVKGAKIYVYCNLHGLWSNDVK